MKVRGQWVECANPGRKAGSAPRDNESPLARLSFPYWPVKLSEPTDEYAAILAPDVPAFREPDASSPQVAVLSYNVLRVARRDPLIVPPFEPNWRRLTLPDGGVGFVQSLYVFRGRDPSLEFGRDASGRWSVNAYVSHFP